MASPTLQERRRRYRSDARQSILDAAESLLAQRGVGGFSMRRLAEICGCTAATLYHYFRDKPGLIATLLDSRLDRVVAELEALPASRDAAARVRDISREFARFAQHNPGHYQLLVEQVRDNVPESPARERLVGLFDDALQELVERGRLRAEDREVFRQGIWSLLHGFILLQATLPDDEWEPDLLDRSVDALIRGSLPAGAEA